MVPCEVGVLSLLFFCAARDEVSPRKTPKHACGVMVRVPLANWSTANMQVRTRAMTRPRGRPDALDDDVGYIVRF
uniref:Putative secreted protein n=1 Tax=Anopheles triannulatus TaxID=58253 RepID=A0A2M4B5A9_9DIPT